MPSNPIAPPLCGSIIDAIGATPLVELGRYAGARDLRGRLLCKLEYLNPGFSKKDRIALEMIRDARAAGTLRDGQPVVELTSGNTGTGLALVFRAQGHPFIAVMSRGNTPERATMMRALGAQVELVEQSTGSPPGQVSGEDLKRVEDRARQLVAETGAFRADQFTLLSNRLAHERHTGPELWDQSGGAIDVFIDFVGSAGTFTGVMRALRQRNPDVRGYVVEPATASVLAGSTITNANHRIQGGGYSRCDLDLYEPTLVDGCVAVTDAQAVEHTRALAREEGIFGGFSTGAHAAAAVELLQTREPGSTLAFLACDSGLKYMSTDLYAC